METDHQEAEKKSPKATKEAKQPQPRRATTKLANKSKPSVAGKGKWVPKLTAIAEKRSLVEDQASTLNTITTKETTIVINSEVTNSTSKPMRLSNLTSGSEFDQLTIKERSFLLEVQLFGTSLI